MGEAASPSQLSSGEGWVREAGQGDDLCWDGAGLACWGPEEHRIPTGTCAPQQELEQPQKWQGDVRNPSPSQLASPGRAGKEQLWPLADAAGAWLEGWSPWGAEALLAAGGGEEEMVCEFLSCSREALGLPAEALKTLSLAE